jgi:hypothetical protein
MPIVRKADIRDEPEIMAMCRDLHRENGIFTMSDDKVRDYLRRAFAKQGAVIGVIGPPGRIEGSIYLMISDFWYSQEWHLAELWSYVMPQYRKSNNAKELINFAKRCSDELKVPAVIGIISNERTKAKVQLYQRQLGTAAGAFFLYGGKTGQCTDTIESRLHMTNGTAGRVAASV